MSDISGPLSVLIEDWAGVTTSVVIPAGQKRWYDGVTGYQSSEVIELIGDGSTTIASLLKRQPLTDSAQTAYGVKTFDDIPVLPSTAPTSANQAANKAYVDLVAAQTFAVVDTDSADVAATTPTSPSDGDKWVVVNSGSSGNYVTGLPGTISLGDGKQLSFIYDTTNTTWRYEDVIIDEYSYTGVANQTQQVTKWAGGSMKINSLTDLSTNTQNLTYAEPFIGDSPMISGNVRSSSSSYGYACFGTTTLIDAVIKARATTNTAVDIPRWWKAEGRWKS